MTAFYTSTGRSIGFELDEFTSEHVCLDDLAHHLAQIGRFGGAGKQFYSTLVHSLLVASIVPEELKLAALLHDAAEAYLGDCVAPLKKCLPDYIKMEKRFSKLIFAALNVPIPDSDEENLIKAADFRAFVTESYVLGPPGLWDSLRTPRDEPVEQELGRLLQEPMGVCQYRFIQALRHPLFFPRIAGP